MTPGPVREVLRRPAGALGAGIVVLLVAAAVVSTFWTPHDPFAADPFQRWLGPSAVHPFGTDGVGRDVLSYVLAASRTTVLVAVLSSVVAALVGLVLASLAALGPRWVREALAVLIDVLIAFPVGVARSGYVLAARASGLGPVRVLLDHVLPNIAPVFIVQLSLSAGVAVLSEAGLSFLGYGAPPSTPSWGRLLSDLQDYVTVHPLTVVWPGLAITVSVLAFNLLGDALRDATDPRLRTRGRSAR